MAAEKEKDWTDLSGEERRAIRFAKWLEPEGIVFPDAETKAAYQERVTRLIDVVKLEKTPDRVPVLSKMGFYPAHRVGMTPYDAMTDTDRALEAWSRATLELQPDALISPLHNTMPAKAFELIDYRLYDWPGHNLPKDAGYQYNEDEYMQPEEYDHLIDDPSDYLWRVYLPRVVGAYEGFGILAPAYDMVELPFTTAHIGPWGAPGQQDGIERLAAAGREVGAWAEKTFPAIARVQAAGFPDLWGYATKAPFDFIGDSLRGTRGVIVDMFKKPEKLIAACDRLAPVMVRWALAHTTVDSAPGIFIPLHKGADGFMSDEQFRTFYWPSFKKVLLGLIDHGFVPWLFAEGGYNSRLEVLTELPKGTTVWMFDKTDMARAKDVLGGTACIQGNVPLSLMHMGTPDEVTAYCRELIGTAGVDGGFILDVGANMESPKEENVRAMIQAAKQYGVYS
ncbi:MAG: uroporphyrinogen decarboxylase family protein [Thermoleophilia bacterium]